MKANMTFKIIIIQSWLNSDQNSWMEEARFDSRTYLLVKLKSHAENQAQISNNNSCVIKGCTLNAHTFFKLG